MHGIVRRTGIFFEGRARTEQTLTLEGQASPGRKGGSPNSSTRGQALGWSQAQEQEEEEQQQQHRGPPPFFRGLLRLAERRALEERGLQQAQPAQPVRPAQPSSRSRSRPSRRSAPRSVFDVFVYLFSGIETLEPQVRSLKYERAHKMNICLVTVNITVLSPSPERRSENGYAKQEPLSSGVKAGVRIFFVGSCFGTATGVRSAETTQRMHIYIYIYI